jgi:hypothetical protein
MPGFFVAATSLLGTIEGYLGARPMLKILALLANVFSWLTHQVARKKRTGQLDRRLGELKDPL